MPRVPYRPLACRLRDGTWKGPEPLVEPKKPVEPHLYLRLQPVKNSAPQDVAQALARIALELGVIAEAEMPQGWMGAAPGDTAEQCLGEFYSQQARERARLEMGMPIG